MSYATAELPNYRFLTLPSSATSLNESATRQLSKPFKAPFTYRAATEASALPDIPDAGLAITGLPRLSAAGNTEMRALFVSGGRVRAALDRALAGADEVADQYLEVQFLFGVLAAQLEGRIYGASRSNFSALLDALREDEEYQRINSDSLRRALKFLVQANVRVAPSFSVRESGNLFLQWFRKAGKSIAGAEFRPSGEVVWSAAGKSPLNAAVRTSAAGVSSVEALGDVLRTHAFWVFAD